MLKVHLSRSNPLFSMVLMGAGSLALAMGVATGCVSPQQFPDDSPEPTGGQGANNGEGAGTSKPPVVVETIDEAKALYFAVDGIFNATCGVGCHDGKGGQTEDLFLDAETPEGRYDRLKAQDGFIKKNWDESVLLVYPRTGATHPTQGSVHGGKNFDTLSDGTLETGLTEWLQAEASLIEAPANPLGAGTEPFTPVMGINAIYLEDIDPQLYGVTVTFMAEEEAGILYVSDLRVYTSNVTGVTVNIPKFAVYPPNKPAVLDRSFTGVKVDVGANETANIGIGSVILTQWEPDSLIAMFFESITPYTRPETGGGGCEAFESFSTGVGGAQSPQQLFRASCGGCHGNNNNNRAVSAIDMTGLTNNAPTGPEEACAQIRVRVSGDYANPANSLIFRNTNPAMQANHDFRFPNANDFNNFRTAVTTWIEAEADAAESAGQ